MSEFKPVCTKADLECLDAEEIVAGYRAGWECADEPGSDKSRGYWHGWRNAQIDKGRMRPDEASAQLAREVVGSARRMGMQ